MAVDSTKIHPISASGTNPIYIDLGRNADTANGITELQPISLDHSNKNKLKITFNNIHIRLTTGHFNYWIGVWPRYTLTYKNASNQNKTKTVSYTVKGTKQVVTLGDGTTLDTWPRQNSQKALIIKDETTWYASTVSRVNATSKVSFASNTYTEEISLTNEEGKGLFKLEIDFDVYSFHTPGGTGSIDQWGCTCADHKEVDFQTVSSGLVYWTSVSAGSASIADNGNNSFTITANTGSGGINNDLHLNRIFYKIVPSGTNADSISYTYDGDYDFTSSTKTMAKTISGACTVYAFVRTYGTKYGTPANPGGDARNKADSTTDSQVIKYYTFPTPPTKIWINTGKASQYTDNIKSSLSAINSGTDQLTANNACKPRNKEILMWKWDGATDGGGAAAIGGFRVYIHRIAKGTTGSPATKTPDNTINLSDKTLYEITNEGKTNEALATYKSTDVSKGSNEMYGFYCDIPYVSGESNDAQFGFIPKDLGFSAGDLCYCEVFTHNTWGDGDRRYSKNSVTDTDYVPIIGSCNIFNGAIVSVRVPRNPPTDNTLVWKEGTVYVYNGTTWKEAEGVYVRKDGQWKEST